MDREYYIELAKVRLERAKELLEFVSLADEAKKKMKTY